MSPSRIYIVLSIRPIKELGQWPRWSHVVSMAEVETGENYDPEGVSHHLREAYVNYSWNRDMNTSDVDKLASIVTETVDVDNMTPVSLKSSILTGV